jgi:RimJ/RimL family protein N-acetyltransferase
MAQPDVSRIETDRLILRHCRESDRDMFFEVCSDPRVLEFFPFRRSREDADAVFDLIRADTSSDGLDFNVLEMRETGEPVGFSGLSRPALNGILPVDAVEIGWRLSARHWGRGFATEAAIALLRQGFETLGLEEIVSFSVQGNDRSEAVMRRIGMRRDPEGDFDHPDIPESHPQLKRHILYRLTAEEWRQQAAISRAARQ